MPATVPTYPPLRALLLACALTPLAALAEDEPIATDRPDFVESSQVVGKGRLQLETSIAIDRDGRERLTSTPTLLRLGLTGTLELRLESDGLQRRHGGDAPPESGCADASLGLKWHVRDQAGALPSMGLLAHVDVPSGSRAFRADGPRSSLRLAAEWEGEHGLSFGVMPGLTSERNGRGGRTATGIFAVVAGKAWTDRLRTFVELSAPRIARARDGGSEASVDTGVAWLLTDRWQVDTAVSHGLNRNTPDLSWTVGLSVRM